MTINPKPAKLPVLVRCSKDRRPTRLQCHPHTIETEITGKTESQSQSQSQTSAGVQSVTLADRCKVGLHKSLQLKYPLLKNRRDVWSFTFARSNVNPFRSAGRVPS